MKFGQRSQLKIDPLPVDTTDLSQAKPLISTVDIFKISPLIRLTLFCLYISLVVPLPFLSQFAGSGIPPQLLWLGIGIGGIALHAALSERVIIDNQAIQVCYPGWVPRFFRRGWSLAWADVSALKPRSTGQGGLVYYFLSKDGQAYLLPMRVAGFARLVDRIQAQTEIDTRDVQLLSQPWMYFILLGCALLLLAIDSWTIWTAINHIS